jgi:hypothetical protein
VLAQPSCDFVCVGSLSFWRAANFDIARATLSWLWACQISLWHGANFDIACATLSALSTCGIALVVVRCEFWCRSRSLLGTLCVSDRSRCGMVLILADSLRSWLRDFMSSGGGPSMTILQELHGAVLEVRNAWSSWPRSCRGPCAKMLGRSWWNPVRGPCMNFNRSLLEDLVKNLLTSLKSPCLILYRTLSEDFVEILVKSFLRGPCVKILQVPCLRGACMKAFLGCSWEVLVSRSCKTRSSSSRSLHDDLVG